MVNTPSPFPSRPHPTIPLGRAKKESLTFQKSHAQRKQGSQRQAEWVKSFRLRLFTFMTSMQISCIVLDAVQQSSRIIYVHIVTPASTVHGSQSRETVVLPP